MTFDKNATLLRSLRQKSGLSQKELAHLLGFRSGIAVSRHERSKSVPDLLTALGYQTIFRVPISELFPGFHETVASGIEECLATMEHELHQSAAKGREAAFTARKLEFLCVRKTPESNSTPS